MGNCVLKRINNTNLHHQLDQPNAQIMIRVATTNGGVMELYAPMSAGQITTEFPGHALFWGRGPVHSAPLQHKELLHPGQLYHLLPLSYATTAVPQSVVPYRVSVDHDSRKRYEPDEVHRSRGKGVWKVRLVINPEQLSEILSQDSRTEELIDNVRAVAKCGAVRA